LELRERDAEVDTWN